MNEDDRLVFGRNLSHYMNRDHVNGVTLAKYMKVSSATISDWMHGKKMPRVDKLKSLANYFRINMSDLTDNKEEYQEVPKILVIYNELNEENKIELLKRADELAFMQRMHEYNTRLNKKGD
jgi:transcriptional regulator with XRE-family HTH domain